MSELPETVRYRYQEQQIGYVGDTGIPVPVVRLDVQKWHIVKRTSCGFWIARDGRLSRRKWVREDTYFCRPTMDSALESFIQRKLHQIAILERQLRVAQAALAEAVSESK